MTKRRNPDSRIYEEMLREEEIRLKVESILDEEDDEVFEEMILGLDEEELDALEEAMGEMEEELDEECDEDEEDECLNEGCMDKGKHRLYEMAQPRHKKVILKIPIINNPDWNPVTITFMAKNPTSRKDVYRYIDMSDVPPSMPDRIVTTIYLADDADSEVSRQMRTTEDSRIRDFAQKVADKYSNGSKKNMRDITDAIISCYNNDVVSHGMTAKSRIPSDFYYVEWDSVNRQVVQR